MRGNKTRTKRSQRYMDVPRGQCLWKFNLCCHFLSQTVLLCALLISCFTIYLQQRCECNDNILFLWTTEEYFSERAPSQNVMQGNMRKIYVLHSWQVCAEVQILSLEIDGSARDRLASDQSAATDISTYAGWIIKNTSDPLWRNKLLLLLHPHMQYVSSGGKVEVIFY